MISVHHPRACKFRTACRYSRKPRTITDLKEAIRKEMRAIPRSVCKDVMDNFVLRPKKELNGGYLEQMLLSAQG